MKQQCTWFAEARYGMFIHWGLYSILERGEWVMWNEAIPPAEYADLAGRFRPKKFDASAWARLARDAGMKYVVLTARHHDGFCLWDSRTTGFTAPKTAAGRDFIAEYVTAVRDAGLKVGLYYSLPDWRWSVCQEADDPFPGDRPKKSPAQWKRFVDTVHAQVEELMTWYGRIDLLWYDGPFSPSYHAWAKPWRSRELNAMVRRHQPQILINNRSGTDQDFATPEQRIHPEENRLWETCMTMNDSWGYAGGDQNWKTPRQILGALTFCVSYGGNYLLNVGPKADGTVPSPTVARLQRVGEWLRRQGESVYGCGRPPKGTVGIMSGYISATGFFTARNDTLYFHILRWPGSELWLKLGNKVGRVKSARLLLNGSRLRVEQNGRRCVIRGLPRSAPDELDTVVKITL